MLSAWGFFPRSSKCEMPSSPRYMRVMNIGTPDGGGFAGGSVAEGEFRVWLPEVWPGRSLAAGRAGLVKAVMVKDDGF